VSATPWVLAWEVEVDSNRPRPVVDETAWPVESAQPVESALLRLSAQPVVSAVPRLWEVVAELKPPTLSVEELKLPDEWATPLEVDEDDPVVDDPPTPELTPEDWPVE
jgi:hypothetical protein